MKVTIEDNEGKVSVERPGETIYDVALLVRNCLSARMFGEETIDKILPTTEDLLEEVFSYEETK